MTKFDNLFMIAAESRPFANGDAWYQFNFDSGTTQNESIRLQGKLGRIGKYGWRIQLYFTYGYVVTADEAKLTISTIGISRTTVSTAS